MKYLTASEMRVFQRCKRRWWLNSYRKLVRINDTNWNKPLGIGNRVHEALAVYYTPDDPTDPRKHLLTKLQHDLESNPEEQHNDIRAEHELSSIMIDGYMDWLAETGEDQAITVIEAERARMARLEPDRDVMLLSKLDARVQHDIYGDRLSLEHKSVSSLSQHLPELRLNQQVLTEHLVEYMALIEEGKDPTPARGVLFNMLRKVKRTARAKPPFYSRIHVHHTLSEIRNHWYHVVSIADQIEEVTRRLNEGESHQLVVPPSPMSDCSWSCPWFRECPMFDNESDDVESSLRDRFEIGDDLQRYEGLLVTLP
jgi:hypothetical protein